MRSLILGDSLHSPAFHLHQLSLWLAFSALYPGGLRGDCHGHSHPLCAPWIRWVPHHSIVRACLSSVDFMANGAWTREGGGQCPNHWWLNACLLSLSACSWPHLHSSALVFARILRRFPCTGWLRARRHRLAVGGGWLRCQLGHREPRRPSQSTLMARLKDRHWSEHGGGRLFQINPPSSAFASWKKRKSPPFQKFQEKWSYAWGIISRTLKQWGLSKFASQPTIDMGGSVLMLVIWLHLIASQYTNVHIPSTISHSVIPHYSANWFPFNKYNIHLFYYWCPTPS